MTTPIVEVGRAPVKSRKGFAGRSSKICSGSARSATPTARSSIEAPRVTSASP